MDKSSIIAKFKAANKPSRKSSGLHAYKNEIISLSEEGYTQAQIIVLLSELGVNTKQSNLSRWIKRQSGEKTSTKSKKQNITTTQPVTSVEQKPVQEKPSITTFETTAKVVESVPAVTNVIVTKQVSAPKKQTKSKIKDTGGTLF